MIRIDISNAIVTTKILQSSLLNKILTLEGSFQLIFELILA